MNWHQWLEPAETLQELADIALPRIKERLRGVAAVINVGSVHGPSLVVGDLERLAPARYFSEFVRDDPLQRYGLRCQERVYTGWRSVPRAELLASRAYAEYYTPRGLGDVIAAGFVDGDYISHEMTSFACFRAHDDTAYGDDDVAFVERSLPAFGAAIARFRPPPIRDPNTELMLSAMVGFLGDRPLLVFDVLGRLMWTAPRARDHLGDSFLPSRALAEAVRDAARTQHLQIQMVPFRLAEHHVTLNVVKRGKCSLVIAELVPGEQLSAAEARIFQAVGQGLSNAAIASLLHVSIATVKSHLHRIFGKLGVQSRVELALLARGRAPPEREPTTTKR